MEDAYGFTEPRERRRRRTEFSELPNRLARAANLYFHGIDSADPLQDETPSSEDAEEAKGHGHRAASNRRFIERCYRKFGTKIRRLTRAFCALPSNRDRCCMVLPTVLQEP